jgi:hypothetical protein
MRGSSLRGSLRGHLFHFRKYPQGMKTLSKLSPSKTLRSTWKPDETIQLVGYAVLLIRTVFSLLFKEASFLSARWWKCDVPFESV